MLPGGRACQLEAFELPDVPPAGGYLMEIHASLISPGTELAIFEKTHRGFDGGGVSFAKYPFLPGYAAVGEVGDSSIELDKCFNVKFTNLPGF